MASSDAETVDEYLTSLPDDRREMISALRDLVLANLPEGLQETMNWGMISYEVPLQVCPNTYNGKPLMFAALASQKRHCSLYMMPVYQDPDKHARLLQAYDEMGRRPNMGKSCIRFTRLEHLPLETLATLISECDIDSFISSSQH